MDCPWSVLALACAVVLSVERERYHSAAATKMKAIQNLLSIALPPNFFNVEEPRGFSDELILPRGISAYKYSDKYRDALAGRWSGPVHARPPTHELLLYDSLPSWCVKSGLARPKQARQLVASGRWLLARRLYVVNTGHQCGLLTAPQST